MSTAAAHLVPSAIGEDCAVPGVDPPRPRPMDVVSRVAPTGAAAAFTERSDPCPPPGSTRFAPPTLSLERPYADCGTPPAVVR
ncbi:hypothetical protein [Streptomyces sp. NPDC058542]|uniref:hypothetical protein n=1 Tax=Streptomyces sp. NPDC058542 TaxID=3346543 RepID=UPI0036642232